MTERIAQITAQETDILCFFNGRIPEANAELNDLQRQKIAAVYESGGRAFIGKVNHYGDGRETLSEDDIFTGYTGQMVYNFEADFVVPAEDRLLAELIVQWNADGLPASLELISKITNRVDEIGGANILWS